MAHPKTDLEILEALIVKAGSRKAFAAALGMSRQAVWEARTRMSDTVRLRMYLYAEKVALELPKGFLKRALTD